MANKKKKKNNSTKVKKKVLEYNDYNKKMNEIRQEAVDVEFNKAKSDSKELDIPENIHEKIQSFISILFTIIIFVLLLFLIFVIYNNYLQPKNKINVEEVCKDYIKKDYKIDKEDVLNYVKNKRYILYNLNIFDKNNISNNDLLEIAKYIIWNTEDEYQKCDDDDKCLVTKKEMEYDILVKEIENILQVKNIKLFFTEENNNKVYLYRKDNKIILTFAEFEYETLKHEVVDILIDNDSIIVYFALSKRIPNSDYYDYIGNKKIILKYKNKQYVLEKIDTDI